MIAAAAALFAACSSNDTFKDVDTQEVQIGFEGFTENVTKAAITSVNDLKGSGVGFTVFGYKSSESASAWATMESTPLFNNVDVTWSSSGTGSWTYSPLRFWDKNAYYKFYAAAPSTGSYSINVATVTSGDDYSQTATLGNKKFGFITINNAASSISTSSADYLIDRDGAYAIGSDFTGSTATRQAVQLDFHHVMAKIVFALKTTISEGTITVKSLSMSGWDQNTGTFVQNSTSTPDQLQHTEWTLATTQNTKGSINLVGSGTGNASDIALTNTDAAPTVLNDWYIMVPQTITYTAPAQNVTEAGLTFTVTYDYSHVEGQTTYTESFTNQVAIVPSNQVWGTDSYTKYTLDIKPAEIKFDVTSICDFHGFQTNESDPNPQPVDVN